MEVLCSILMTVVRPHDVNIHIPKCMHVCEITQNSDSKLSTCRLCVSSARLRSAPTSKWRNVQTTQRETLAGRGVTKEEGWVKQRITCHPRCETVWDPELRLGSQGTIWVKGDAELSLEHHVGCTGAHIHGERCKVCDSRWQNKSG